MKRAKDGMKLGGYRRDLIFDAKRLSDCGSPLPLSVAIQSETGVSQSKDCFAIVNIKK
jgi:hypothetical protein